MRDPTQDARDRYGRTLAYVDVGARDAGEEMVRGGWAKPYVYGDVPFERLGALSRGGVGGAAGARPACTGRARATSTGPGEPANCALRGARSRREAAGSDEPVMTACRPDPRSSDSPSMLPFAG